MRGDRGAIKEDARVAHEFTQFFVLPQIAIGIILDNREKRRLRTAGARAIAAGD
jgi:hypothetical protein